MERKFKGKSLWEFPDDYTVVDIETNGIRRRCAPRRKRLLDM